MPFPPESSEQEPWLIEPTARRRSPSSGDVPASSLPPHPAVPVICGFPSLLRIIVLVLESWFKDDMQRFLQN